MTDENIETPVAPLEEKTYTLTELVTELDRVKRSSPAEAPPPEPAADLVEAKARELVQIQKDTDLYTAALREASVAPDVMNRELRAMGVEPKTIDGHSCIEVEGKWVPISRDSLVAVGADKTLIRASGRPGTGSRSSGEGSAPFDSRPLLERAKTDFNVYRQLTKAQKKQLLTEQFKGR